MKNIQTFEEFLNESRLNEANKEKFLLYTNPNNSTNRAYVAIGSAKVKDVMSRARKYSGSYDILHQGNGTNDDLQKAISMFRQYNFGDVSMDEGFLNEGSRYSIYKNEIEWKQNPKKPGSYLANSGNSELEIRQLGYGNWALRVDGKVVPPSETAKEKTAKDNHTNYNNWSNDWVGALKHTAQEMFESFLGEAKSSEYKTVDVESDIIEKIKKLLPHMHQKDADHNAKVMLKQYKDGTLKSGVIYNQIKRLKSIDESFNESIRSSDARKAASWINNEYEKDGFDREAFGYALKDYFKKVYPSEDLQSEILDILSSKHRFNFEPNKSALIISPRMY